MRVGDKYDDFLEIKSRIKWFLAFYPATCCDCGGKFGMEFMLKYERSIGRFLYEDDHYCKSCFPTKSHLADHLIEN